MQALQSNEENKNRTITRKTNLIELKDQDFKVKKKKNPLRR